MKNVLLQGSFGGDLVRRQGPERPLEQGEVNTETDLQAAFFANLFG